MTGKLEMYVMSIGAKRYIQSRLMQKHILEKISKLFCFLSARTSIPLTSPLYSMFETEPAKGLSQLRIKACNRGKTASLAPSKVKEKNKSACHHLLSLRNISCSLNPYKSKKFTGGLCACMAFPPNSSAQISFTNWLLSVSLYSTDKS